MIIPALIPGLSFSFLFPVAFLLFFSSTTPESPFKRWLKKCQNKSIISQLCDVDRLLKLLSSECENPWGDYYSNKHSWTFFINPWKPPISCKFMENTYWDLLYRVSQKTHHKEMRNFLTLKMLPLTLSLIKLEKCHLLAPLVKKHPFYIGNCSNH